MVLSSMVSMCRWGKICGEQFSLISFVIESINLNTFTDGMPVILSEESSTPKTMVPPLPFAKAMAVFTHFFGSSDSSFPLNSRISDSSFLRSSAVIRAPAIASNAIVYKPMDRLVLASALQTVLYVDSHRAGSLQGNCRNLRIVKLAKDDGLKQIVELPPRFEHAVRRIDWIYWNEYTNFCERWQ